MEEHGEGIGSPGIQAGDHISVADNSRLTPPSSNLSADEVSSSVSYCPACGAACSPEFHFCASCGTAVGAATAPAQVAAPSSGPSRKTATKLIVVATVAVLIAGGFLLVSRKLGTATKHTVDGTLELHDVDKFLDLRDGASCRGSGGYNDIGPGTTMTVKDGAGQVMGVGSLTGGTKSDLATCTFKFTIADISDADFYAVAIGGGRRGDLNYSKSDLESKLWQVDLTIGGS